MSGDLGALQGAVEEGDLVEDAVVEIAGREVEVSDVQRDVVPDETCGVIDRQRVLEHAVHEQPVLAHQSVTDSGHGMDEEFIKNRLFRPFDSTKGLTGMGIGAYECREVITALGGQVVVESQPGQGTVFRIMLPLADNSVTA